ncbi:MAG: PKD domain-containing protein, partial [Bacteroidetes bacterium]
MISCTKSDPVVEKTMADFEAITADTLGNFEVKFTNKSKNATSFLWDFGNGKRSTDKDPKHKYTEGGIFTVRLSATGLNGTDRITRSI